MAATALTRFVAASNWPFVVGATTDPWWRMIGCNGHKQMVPHGDRGFNVMYQVFIESGHQIAAIERHAISECRAKSPSRCLNVKDGGDGTIRAGSIYYLYLAVKD